MKYLIRNHIYKFIYILILLTTVYRIFSFESNVIKDRKALKEGNQHVITCTIASLPTESYDTVSFTGKCLKGLKINEKLCVNIKYADLSDFCPGDTLTLRGTIEHPDTAMNPGGFDNRSYLKSQGVSVIFNSSLAEINYHKKSNLTSFYKIRDKITRRIYEFLPEDEASLATALVTGSKSKMSNSLKENYRRAGVYHVIAVSGLHLSMLIMFISSLYINLKLKRRYKSIIALAGAFAAGVFMFVFTGFGVSVQRAALMAVIVCSVPFLSREYSPFISLFCVMCTTLLLEPYSYSDISFQLSFSATAGVLIGASLSQKYSLNTRKFGSVLESFMITLCANLISLPFVVSAFKGVSVSGLVSNLIILLIVPSALGMSYLFSALCIWAPELICRLFSYIAVVPVYAMNMLTGIFAEMPFGYINITIKLLAVILLQIIGIYILIKLRKRKISFVLSMIFIIANFSFVSYNIDNEQCSVTFLNVGQGECTLISDTDSNTMMIDCGSESKPDTGQTEVIPYLNSKGIYHLDALVVTHYHDDHINGIYTLIEKGYVKKLIVPDRVISADEKYSSKKLYETAVKHRIPIERVCKGDKISFGKKGVLKVLSPESSYRLDANNNSLVTSFEYEGVSFLFTADIEEYGMYAVMDDIEDTDVIKVAHHGGRSTLSDNIAKKANAEYAVISCGKNNRYNHPHPDTLKKFKSSKILRTDIHKAITFTIKNHKLIKE